ncbi:hypothetical protein TNCV_3831131 [Trichonephila clavipes]|nr:hypothetical protein TNCV_3831131 [Trichonephila clavipes]
MVDVDFLHHENPPTWGGIEPATVGAQKTSDKPTTSPSRLVTKLRTRLSDGILMYFRESRNYNYIPGNGKTRKIRNPRSDMLDLSRFSVYKSRSTSANGARRSSAPRARNELKPALSQELLS